MPSGKKVKWVRLENVHLTLKFLGEVEENRLEELKNALKKSVKGQKGFTLQVKGAGVFPNVKRPKVLWAGIEDSSKSLEKLAGNVEEAAVATGFSSNDKPFSAHLTVARIDPSSPPDLTGVLKQYENFLFGEIPVEKIGLVQSRLMPSGPQYTLLEECPFNGN